MEFIINGYFLLTAAHSHTEGLKYVGWNYLVTYGILILLYPLKWRQLVAQRTMLLMLIHKSSFNRTFFYEGLGKGGGKPVHIQKIHFVDEIGGMLERQGCRTETSWLHLYPER